MILLPFKLLWVLSSDWRYDSNQFTEVPDSLDLRLLYIILLYIFMYKEIVVDVPFLCSSSSCPASFVLGLDRLVYQPGKSSDLWVLEFVKQSFAVAATFSRGARPSRISLIVFRSSKQCGNFELFETSYSSPAISTARPDEWRLTLWEGGASRALVKPATRLHHRHSGTCDMHHGPERWSSWLLLVVGTVLAAIEAMQVLTSDTL